jgi:actin-related protein
VRPDLCRNVVLAGGSAAFAGLQPRLETELSDALLLRGGAGTAPLLVQVVAPWGRVGWDRSAQSVVWDGGSALASSHGSAAPELNPWAGCRRVKPAGQHQRRSHWVTQAEYKWYGPRIVHRVCF